MPNWINNLVRPVNDAAKEFTKKYIVNEEGLFCFGNLVPVPDILSKTKAPSRVVTPEKLQAFKDEHQQSVHCEYEQKGLLYTLDEDGDVEDAVCTFDCVIYLEDMYGCDNWYDFCVQNWGTKWEADNDPDAYDDDGEPEVYDFNTAWDPPWNFMATLAKQCPEGIWEWRCLAEGWDEELLVKLQDGDVIITKHLLREDDLDDLNIKSIDAIYWNDRGEVPEKGENDTRLVLGKVLKVRPNCKVRCAPPFWPNWVDNCVKPLNDAAKDFIEKHVYEEEEDQFCFGKLVPVPDILTKIKTYSYLLSPKGIQAFKNKHQPVHCEYEQEGLLYTLDEDGDVQLSVYTAECSARLKDMYGCDNWYDFIVQNWGDTEVDSGVLDEDDDGKPFYRFRTDWSVPWGFMSALAKECPEGQWEWRCDAANGFESLVLQLRNGEVVITEHSLDEKKLESMRDCEGKPKTIDDIHWNDRGEVLAHGVKNDTKLVLGKVFSVKPNYVVPKNLWGA